MYAGCSRTVFAPFLSRRRRHTDDCDSACLIRGARLHGAPPGGRTANHSHGPSVHNPNRYTTWGFGPFRILPYISQTLPNNPSALSSNTLHPSPSMLTQQPINPHNSAHLSRSIPSSAGLLIFRQIGCPRGLYPIPSPY